MMNGGNAPVAAKGRGQMPPLPPWFLHLCRVRVRLWREAERLQRKAAMRLPHESKGEIVGEAAMRLRRQPESESETAERRLRRQLSESETGERQQ